VQKHELRELSELISNHITLPEWIETMGKLNYSGENLDYNLFIQMSLALWLDSVEKDSTIDILISALKATNASTFTVNRIEGI